MNKGFIFSGDSFVWGEGLELFSNLPSTKKYFDTKSYTMAGPYNRAWHPEYTNSMRLFQQNHRFSRLVSTHFNTWDDVYDRNGGDPYTIIDELLTQIQRTPLTDVSSIIIHPTHPWRAADIIINQETTDSKSILGGSSFVGKHPTHKFFSTYKEADTGSLSKLTLDSTIPYFGTNLGFKKYQSELSKDFFDEIENNWYQLIEFSFKYSEYKNGNIDIDQVTINGTKINDKVESLKKYDIFLDFCKLELSNFGTDFIKINKKLEIQLCGDWIRFIEKYIKPDADLHNVNISFLPVWNETWESYKNAGVSFYNKNVINIHLDGKYLPSFNFVWNDYTIEHTKGYEWTRNMHPNLEGHKLIADSIIHYLEKNDVL